MKEPVRENNFFYIKLKDGIERRWKPGQSKPLIHSDEVVELEAFDKALEEIRVLFPELTPVGKTSAMWFGDLARTIFSNMAK